jgi:hypothetical protein
LIAVYGYFRYIVVVCFNGGGNWNSDEKTIDLPQVTDELYHIMMQRVDLTILLVIGTDCTGSCNFNYRMVDRDEVGFITTYAMSAYHY